MLSRLLASEQGRLALLALIVGFAVYIGAAGPESRLDFWRQTGIPTMSPTFGDARVITSGWECVGRGVDVLVENPCDPFGRQMNYPRIWTVPALLVDVGQGWTGRLAAIFAAAFFVSVLAVVGRIGIGTAAIYGIALASPSVMLALERGNSDLLIFALVATAVVLSVRGHLLASAAALLLSVVLKLYPVAAIGVLKDRRARVVGGAISVGYAVVNSGDIELILAHTSRQTGWSYGLLPASSTLLPEIPQPAAQIVLGAIGLVVVAVVARVRPMPAVSPLAGAAFHAGAAIYVATYLVGGNWDYRLIFLLLTLPALIEVARAGRYVLVCLVLAALWTSRDFDAPWFWVDQLVKTAVVVGCVAGLLGDRLRPDQGRNLPSPATASP